MKTVLISIVAVLLLSGAAFFLGRSTYKNKCDVLITEWENRFEALHVENQQIQAQAEALVKIYQDSVTRTLLEVEDLKRRNINLNYKYNEARRNYQNVSITDSTVGYFVNSWSRLVEEHPLPDN